MLWVARDTREDVECKGVPAFEDSETSGRLKGLIAGSGDFFEIESSCATSGDPTIYSFGILDALLFTKLGSGLLLIEGILG